MNGWMDGWIGLIIDGFVGLPCYVLAWCAQPHDHIVDMHACMHAAVVIVVVVVGVNYMKVNIYLLLLCMIS